MKKIDIIAITEHNNIDGAVAFRNYCKKHGNKVKVIVGEEIMTDKGEIIGLYLNKPVPAGMSVEKSIDAIRSQKGIVYVPHPYDEKRAKTVLNETEIAKHRLQIDCIECHNGRNISSYYDIRQADIAKKYDLPMVIGSDAHTVFEIGRNYMNIDIEPYDANSFKKAIAKAKFHKMKCIKICHLITKAARMIQLLNRGKIDELYRIIYRKIKR